MLFCQCYICSVLCVFKASFLFFLTSLHTRSVFCHWKLRFHKPPAGAAVALPTLDSLHLSFQKLSFGSAARTCCLSTCLGSVHHTHAQEHAHSPGKPTHPPSEHFVQKERHLRLTRSQHTTALQNKQSHHHSFYASIAAPVADFTEHPT